MARLAKSAASTAGKPAKSPKSKAAVEKVKKVSAPKKVRSHPPYYEMIKEAIATLKERTGSSVVAIAKFVEDKQKNNLPANFKKLLSVQLKKLVASEKLTKVKNSYKLSAPVKTVEKKPKKAPAVAKKEAPKRKRTAAATEPKEKKPKKAAPAAAVKKATVKKTPVKKAPVKKTAVKKVVKPKSIKSPAAKKAKK